MQSERNDPTQSDSGAGMTKRARGKHPRSPADPKSEKGKPGTRIAEKPNVPNWDRNLLTTPQRRGSYNDDLGSASYGKSFYHVADARRPGIFESIIDAAIREDHMVKACAAESPISKETKLPHRPRNSHPLPRRNAVPGNSPFPGPTSSQDGIDIPGGFPYANRTGIPNTA